VRRSEEAHGSERGRKRVGSPSRHTNTSAMLPQIRQQPNRLPAHLQRANVHIACQIYLESPTARCDANPFHNRCSKTTDTNRAESQEEHMRERDLA
jgi:hypothetical protein